MKLSKLIKTFETYISLGDKKENIDEKQILLNKLYEKKKEVKKKIKQCKDCDKKEKLQDKLKAVKELIYKAKKEFI